MWYLIVENNAVVGVQNMEPNVPAGTTVHQISDSDYKKLQDDTHYWNIDTSQIVAFDADHIAQQEQTVANGNEREFLNTTDWKVLRHIRQKHLGITTSLTEAEYTELEQQREAAASRIIE
tara:strand:- start:306 stop:665 length:360 start_codon:yes stop_codon:yes gene_type:complete